MKIPILEENLYSVLISELATGHVLTKDLNLFRHGEDERDLFQIFDSISNAKQFVECLINGKPEVECSIFNCDGEHVSTFDINGERKFGRNKISNS